MAGLREGLPECRKDPTRASRFQKPARAASPAGVPISGGSAVRAPSFRILNTAIWVSAATRA
jgi:hypothetical protein